MFLTNNDAGVLIQNANTELAKLSKWFAANKLSLNIKKTNFSFEQEIKRLITRQK
jgi:flagellar basal body P-ring protein FlgI